MQRIKFVGIIAIGLLTVGQFDKLQAQDGPNQRNDREQRDDGRRGFGGRSFGGRGFGGRGGPGGSRGGMMGLLRIDEVREELQLSEDQQELVQILGEELREKRPEFPENFREMSEQERRDFGQKMEKFSMQQNQEAKAALRTILEPPQFERLTEISIQTEGTAALADPDVAARLKLSDDQETKIAETIEKNGETSREKMGALFAEARNGGGDRESMRTKIEEIRSEGDKLVLAQLTDEQKADFESMKGEKFAMPEPQFGGRRGGGRGPGGGGNRNRPGRQGRPE